MIEVAKSVRRRCAARRARPRLVGRSRTVGGLSSLETGNVRGVVLVDLTLVVVRGAPARPDMAQASSNSERDGDARTGFCRIREPGREGWRMNEPSLLGRGRLQVSQCFDASSLEIEKPAAARWWVCCADRPMHCGGGSAALLSCQ